MFYTIMLLRESINPALSANCCAGVQLWQHGWHTHALDKGRTPQALDKP